MENSLTNKNCSSLILDAIARHTQETSIIDIQLILLKFKLHITFIIKSKSYFLGRKISILIVQMELVATMAISNECVWCMDVKQYAYWIPFYWTYRVNAVAKTSAYFGQGNSQMEIWMDDVNCQGDEIDLFRCNRTAMGSHNCQHSEDAGVVCSLGLYIEIHSL